MRAHGREVASTEGFGEFRSRSLEPVGKSTLPGFHLFANGPWHWKGRKLEMKAKLGQIIRDIRRPPSASILHGLTHFGQFAPASLKARNPRLPRGKGWTCHASYGSASFAPMVFLQAGVSGKCVQRCSDLVWGASKATNSYRGNAEHAAKAADVAETRSAASWSGRWASARCMAMAAST